MTTYTLRRLVEMNELNEDVVDIESVDRAIAITEIDYINNTLVEDFKKTIKGIQYLESLGLTIDISEVQSFELDSLNGGTNDPTIEVSLNRHYDEDEFFEHVKNEVRNIENLVENNSKFNTTQVVHEVETHINDMDNPKDVGFAIYSIETSINTFIDYALDLIFEQTGAINIYELYRYADEKDLIFYIDGEFA